MKAIILVLILTCCRSYGSAEEGKILPFPAVSNDSGSRSAEASIPVVDSSAELEAAARNRAPRILRGGRVYVLRDGKYIDAVTAVRQDLEEYKRTKAAMQEQTYSQPAPHPMPLPPAEGYESHIYDSVPLSNSTPQEQYWSSPKVISDLERNPYLSELKTKAQVRDVREALEKSLRRRLMRADRIERDAWGGGRWGHGDAGYVFFRRTTEDRPDRGRSYLYFRNLRRVGLAERLRTSAWQDYRKESGILDEAEDLLPGFRLSSKGRTLTGRAAREFYGLR